MKPRTNTWIGRILKVRLTKKGYFVVALNGKDGRKDYRLCRLVALAFHGPCPRGKEVNHIDTNKQNDRPWNLEYITHKKNKEHAKKFGLVAHGSTHGSAKLTEEKVLEIRTKGTTGNYTQEELAKEFGVSHVSIGSILRRENWTHI